MARKPAKKSLVLIHGRSWKPPEAALRSLWLDAIRWGLRRDSPQAADAFARVAVEFVYYGDVNNAFLEQALRTPWQDDTASRHRTLDQLKAYDAGDFNRRTYARLPGRKSLKEGAADLLSPVLGFFQLSQRLIDHVAPDMAEYWNDETTFGSMVRLPMIKPLRRALDRGGPVAVVGHSLGSLIAYDTLWKFSRYGEYVDYWQHQVDLFVTLGSPLGDATVQRHLKGHRIDGARRFPGNIRRWVNIAAEDDFVCHDGKLADDYREMRQLGLVGSIRDLRIHNLSVRDGKSNPHHISGYLIHPRTIGVLAEWILA